MNFKTLQNIQNKIITKSNEYYLIFLQFLKENKDPNINEFLEKYIEWHLNYPTRNYIMFDKVIPQGEYCIFWSLHNFVVNYFLDDSYFTVKWRIIEYVDEKRANVPCEKDDMFAEPYVEYDGDCGTQDPRVILDAMYQYEKNQKAMEEDFEKSLNQLLKNNGSKTTS